MDADLVTLAVMQALPGFTSEARWLRHADHHGHEFEGGLAALGVRLLRPARKVNPNRPVWGC